MISTTDIWFASFLMLHEYSVVNYDVLNGRKGKYYFNLSDDKWKEMKLLFSTSDISKAKMHHITLKDLIF